MTTDTAGDTDPVEAFAQTASTMPAGDLAAIVIAAGSALGAASVRLLVADYAVLSLHELGDTDPDARQTPIEGTLAGRAFVREEVVVSGDGPITVWVPLTEDSERVGVLQLEFTSWDEQMLPGIEATAHMLTLIVLSKRRYTDALFRSRRSEPLSVAAEIQWDLLPPLSYVTDEVSICGMLEPAYSIGGDSFDYAVNGDHVEFSIVDAVGRGMPAVLKSVLAINTLRNARREQIPLESAYLHAGELLAEEWHDSSFVTGQIASLELATGRLSWLNAGHPLPLLVRGGRCVGELHCRPSLPMGLGGEVVEVASNHLQPGDRVLFYTDGVTDTRSADGEPFGLPRLIDYLERATLDRVHPTETVRHLSASIVHHNGIGLSDDATLLHLEYRGQHTSS
ncbi:PP2C family protein-serine/threonine phosphatase [Rhabdothermincola salaria]|uniref:PP2C family protein-serine/threonine phosphatase n=1 Tax=Rhabdothermincola salaria TaxID=2903142 RepID=UPI001E32DA83|nr:PP2C family protein-serine/threonine phosphatase [Rhabdothermincola salaria]MCD9625011.1 serine/threonine-protein phosphatase [Rhabdothermincola salaria]